MADVEQILRLMEHAADLLEEVDVPLHNALAEFRGMSALESTRIKATDVQRQYTVAAVNARATLRLVASFLTAEETDDHGD